MNVYETGLLGEKLASNPYPGRGIVLGETPDGKCSVAAYFIMGRSSNSRNRIFVEEPDGIRTEAYDPSKLEDRVVTLGRSDDTYIEILSGLQEGDQLVVVGQAYLEDGAPVRIVTGED